jgi:hypothetical protein
MSVLLALQSRKGADHDTCFNTCIITTWLCGWGLGCAGAPGGVNYLAILDTAADVAKAMLHLHSLNVLHSDL